MTHYYRTELEDGVPLTPHRAGATKYPFREMQIGQSIFVPVIGFAPSYWRDATGFNLKTRRVRDDAGHLIGTRVWRV